jgi:ubiquinone/menaquinone biosynthesis C-methylase UbiE
VPDTLFAHPKLAPVYDAFDGQRGDLDVYIDLVRELGADRVLDLGCGTGSLAVQLASEGIQAIGVDPATASLEVARGKDRKGEVTWSEGDATTLPAVEVDLVVMTGNVAQVFLSDDDWNAALRLPLHLRL